MYGYDKIELKISAGNYTNPNPWPAEGTREQGKSWRQETARLEREVFEADLAEAYELIDHPKRAMLFAKAWDMGHSSGLTEVLHYYDELVELVK